MVRNFSKIGKEYTNFRAYADEWWLENGNFSLLHKINPLRIKYIVNQISLNIQSKKNKLNGLKIIDIGCGGGLVCEPLSRLGAKVTGVDFVPQNIKIAKEHALKNNLKINYKLENLNNLKINNKYDVILLLEVIEHLDDWKKIIKKIDKIIKPKGLVIISTINRNIFSRILALFFAENILNWIPKGTHSYHKLVKPNELIQALKYNNYKILNITGMNYDPIIRHWFLSNNKKINYLCTAKKIS